MKRASNAQDKIKRRQALIETAAVLFRDNDYASVTMAQIARRSGLAKGTVYLYFRSKEELFISLVTEAITDWFAELEAELEARDPGDTDELAAIIATTLVSRPTMTRLLAILHVVLEQNIPAEAALAFKTRLLEAMHPVGARLESYLPDDATCGGMRLLLWIHALVVGLVQMTTPSEAVADALATPELAPLKLEFHHELTTMLTLLLRGLSR